MKLRHVVIVFNFVLIVVLFIEPFLSIFGLLFFNILFISYYLLLKKHTKENSNYKEFIEFTEKYSEIKNNLNIPKEAITVISYTSDLNFILNFSYIFWIENNSLCFLAEEPHLINFQEFSSNHDNIIIKLDVEKIEYFSEFGEYKQFEQLVEKKKEVSSKLYPIIWTLIKKV